MEEGMQQEELLNPSRQEQQAQETVTPPQSGQIREINSQLREALARREKMQPYYYRQQGGQ